MRRARLGGDAAPAGLLDGGAMVVEGAIGGVVHLADEEGTVENDVQADAAEEKLGDLKVTTGDDGFEDESLGVWGRDDRLECFNRGEALGFSVRARPLLGDAVAAIVAAPPLLEAEERALRDGDWAYCGYEGDLKSSGDRALSEDEEGRGMISDDIVDDDDDEVPMQGGVEFIAAILNHVVAVVGGWGWVGGLRGYLKMVITGGSRSRTYG